MNLPWTSTLSAGSIVLGVVILFPWAVIGMGRYFDWVVERYGN